MINFRVSETELNQLNMQQYCGNIPEDEYKEYFCNPAGRDHYRLLAFISTCYDNKILLDIGTNRGTSAYALSLNKKNKIYSFDIQNYVTLSSKPDNVEFVLDDSTKKEYEHLIRNCNFIFLDTFHDGIFERKFLSHLKSLNWSGFLLLDDIYLNKEMADFWNEITEEKYDISHLGHYSGTGLVIYK
jgi:hypothetical protein